MSLVPEVLTTVHAGFKVLGLVGVTQMVNPASHQPLSIEAMLDGARRDHSIVKPTLILPPRGVGAFIHARRPPRGP